MNELKSTISLCKKAGLLAEGFHLTEDAIKKSKAHLILTAVDVSPKTAKETSFLAGNAKIEMRPVPLTMDDIGRATGKRAGVLAVLDGGLAVKVMRLIDCTYGKE